MFLCRLVLVFFGTSPILTAVVTENEDSCSRNEIACGDGRCISSDWLCNGVNDCFDGSDEVHCNPGLTHSELIPGEGVVLRRERRQSRCRKSEWPCRDGTCVSFYNKCDGTRDCPDGSDETHALCKGTFCQPNWFRCAYGACVDGSALCNGVEECADKSDELNPRCNNGSQVQVARGQYRCDNGQTISKVSVCDGTIECADGSDESVGACAGTMCAPYLFQCAYGACVDQGADCNGKQDCADGSDEADDLCNRMGTGVKPSTSTTTNRPSTGACILPPFPSNGRYTVGGLDNAAPGQRYDVVNLNVTCNPGFGPSGGNANLFCIDGQWSDSIPQCVRYCKLTPHPSVRYNCIIQGAGTQGTRPCNDYEAAGTLVSPECNAPNYYFSGVLSVMRCIDGSWDYVARCNAECGTVTPRGAQLILGGRLAERGEVPWHAAVYRKTTNPYEQICGATVVTTTLLVSAAHCFWSDVDKLLPASRYAVGAGKLYRPWGNPQDVDAQKRDVSDIKVPKRFQGRSANFQDDLALVFVSIAFEFQTFLRPICLDFDVRLDASQLSPGAIGKVAGWGLTAVNGDASQILKVVDMPYIDIDECIDKAPPGFREYITSDKICAGYTNGTGALCHGDSGGGLAFPKKDGNVVRYYLRGVVSTAPSDQNRCNAYALTAFTQLIKHEYFIKEYWTN